MEQNNEFKPPLITPIPPPPAAHPRPDALLRFHVAKHVCRQMGGGQRSWSLQRGQQAQSRRHEATISRRWSAHPCRPCRARARAGWGLWAAQSLPGWPDTPCACYLPTMSCWAGSPPTPHAMAASSAPSTSCGSRLRYPFSPTLAPSPLFSPCCSIRNARYFTAHPIPADFSPVHITQ